MLKQISIYAENTKGAMAQMLGILADADINIRASVTNDSAEYGMVRMIVSDPVKAQEVLSAAGYLCKLTDVLGIELEDKPGSLAKLTAVLGDMNINMDYIYLCFNRNNAMPVLIVHSEYLQEVEESLTAQGFCLQQDM